MRRNKYNASRVEIDGIKFASKKEATRYCELQLLERAGEIAMLIAHPAYPLVVNETTVGKYTPDFRYYEPVRGFIRGCDVQQLITVVEEVKGGDATKTEAYKLRVKLFKALYPYIEHREV